MNHNIITAEKNRTVQNLTRVSGRAGKNPILEQIANPPVRNELLLCGNFAVCAIISGRCLCKYRKIEKFLSRILDCISILTSIVVCKWNKFDTKLEHVCDDLSIFTFIMLIFMVLLYFDVSHSHTFFFSIFEMHLFSLEYNTFLLWRQSIYI